MPQSSSLGPRLLRAVNAFSYHCSQQSDDESNGALAQVWMLEPDAVRGHSTLSTKGAPFCLMGTSNLLAMYRLASSRHRFCPMGSDSALGRVFAALQPDAAPTTTPCTPSPSSAAADRALQAQRCRIRSIVLLPLFDLRAAATALGGDKPASEITAEDAAAVSLPVAVFEVASHAPLLDFDAIVSLLNAALSPEGLGVPKLCTAQAVATEQQPPDELAAVAEAPEGAEGPAEASGGDKESSGKPLAMRSLSSEQLTAAWQQYWGRRAATSPSSGGEQQQQEEGPSTPRSPSPAPPASPRPGGPAHAAPPSARRTRRWSCVRTNGPALSCVNGPLVPASGDFDDPSVRSGSFTQSQGVTAVTGAFIVTEYLDAMDGPEDAPGEVSSSWLPGGSGGDRVGAAADGASGDDGGGSAAAAGTGGGMQRAHSRLGGERCLGSFETPMRRAASRDTPSAASHATFASGAHAHAAGSAGPGDGPSRAASAASSDAVSAGHRCPSLPSFGAGVGGGGVGGFGSGGHAQFGAATNTNTSSAPASEIGSSRDNLVAATAAALASAAAWVVPPSTAGGRRASFAHTEPLPTLSVHGSRAIQFAEEPVDGAAIELGDFSAGGLIKIPSDSGAVVSVGAFGLPPRLAVHGAGAAAPSERPSTAEAAVPAGPAPGSGGTPQQVQDPPFRAPRARRMSDGALLDAAPSTGSDTSSILAGSAGDTPGSKLRLTPGRRLSAAIKGAFSTFARRSGCSDHQQKQHHPQQEQQQRDQGTPAGAASGRGLKQQWSGAAAPRPAAATALQLTPAASAPAAALGRVRVLLAHGGSFACTRAHCLYEGGSKKLVTLSVDGGLMRLQEQVAAAIGSGAAPQHIQIKYSLPGSADVLLDLITDEDVETMVEEYSEYSTAAAHSGAAPEKLHLFADAEMGRWEDATARAAAEAATSLPLSVGSRPPGPPSSSSASRSSSGGGAAGAGAAQRGAGARGPSTGTDGTPRSAAVATTGSGDTAAPTACEQLRDVVNDLRSRVEIIRPWELQVVRLLGAGAFGEVYLARWRSTEVAVKCLSPSLLVADGSSRGSHSTAAASDLMRETGILASLRHPNVVAVYGAVLPTCGEGAEDSGSHASEALFARGPRPSDAPTVRPPALVVEYLAQGSLRAAINARADFLSSPQARVKLLLDTARGLDYLHGKRIVHFDLKSANILVGIRDKVPHGKLCDFGLAKQRRQTYVTGVTSLRGTLPWMAPEILRSPDAVNERSDIYSFGVVMWELWTFNEPFADLPLHALLHALTQPEGLQLPLPGDPDWDTCSPDAPPEPAPGYEALLRRCWSRAASDRPRASEVVFALEEMAAALRRRRAAGVAAAAAAASAAAAAPGAGAAGPAVALSPA